MDFRAINPYYIGWFYNVAKHLQGLAFSTIWRRRVYGRENIPPFGTPAIFAANHRSLSDPSNAGSAIPYPIFFFAKEELFSVPLVGWCIRRVNSFPVRRGEHDIGAFKTALRVLENGGGLMLFPEGGRRLDPKRQWKAKSGVGMLACKTQAQVIPVGITNADHFTRLGRLQVRFGKPVMPPANPTQEDYQRVTDEVMGRIKELCHE